jgi:hypothetical protein
MKLDFQDIPKHFQIKLIASLVMCFILTSCSSSEVSTTEPSISFEQTSPIIGTNGQLISIQSENVSAAGYDEATKVMTVLFDSGRLYEYYGVPADLWISFVEAQPDPWRKVGNPRLVNGGFLYKRIG